MKKIFKNLHYLALAVLSLGILNSCNKEYLDTAPTDRIAEQDAYKTADNLMAVVSGMHRSLYVRLGTQYGGAQGYSGIGGMMIALDTYGEDLVHTALGGNWHIADARWQTNANENSSTVLYLYASMYKLIRNANTIITYGAAATGDPSLRDRAIGEAYAYRAFCYYNLVQLFGKRYNPSAVPNTQLGVPLVLDLDLSPKPRATVEEVYAQINSDLNTSLALLTGKSRGNTGPFLTHFNENVVRGLMARVALTQGNWSVAATQANLARTGFALMSNTQYKNGFSASGNGEWMWGVQILLTDQSDVFGDFGGYMSRNFNSSTIRLAPKAINSTLYNSFAATDVRRQVFDPTGNHTTLGLPSNFVKKPYTSQKFLAVSASDARSDVPLMRSGEMYLIEAEALARNGQETASKTVFNAFETNRNPSYTGAVTTGQAYIDEILKSRRFELWGEGFRFYDLKRLNLPLDRNGANHVATVINNVYNVPETDKRWQLLIPRTEINANPLIIQNDL